MLIAVWLSCLLAAPPVGTAPGLRYPSPASLTHHLIDKIGTEQGYLLAESNGLDIDDAIHVAKRLLKGRIARQVWRGFHKHAFARRCYADPSDANLAEQHRARKQHDDDQDERQERQLIHQFCGWRHAQTHAHAGRGGG